MVLQILLFLLWIDRVAELHLRCIIAANSLTLWCTVARICTWDVSTALVSWQISQLVKRKKKASDNNVKLFKARKDAAISKKWSKIIPRQTKPFRKTRLYSRDILLAGNLSYKYARWLVGRDLLKGSLKFRAPQIYAGRTLKMIVLQPPIEHREQSSAPPMMVLPGASSAKIWRVFLFSFDNRTASS